MSEPIGVSADSYKLIREKMNPDGRVAESGIQIYMLLEILALLEKINTNLEALVERGNT